MKRRRKSKRPLSETTRQNRSILATSAFRTIARGVIIDIWGEGHDTTEKIHRLARSQDFQEMVGDVVRARGA
jgi:hypothetical protein